MSEDIFVSFTVPSERRASQRSQIVVPLFTSYILCDEKQGSSPRSAAKPQEPLPFLISFGCFSLSVCSLTF